jgi:hypothetical protein
MTSQLAFKGSFTAAEDGTFTGMASVFGNTDRQNDRVMPGAFAKAIAEDGDQVPILWQHNPGDVLGTMRVAESPRGLRVVEGKLVLGVQKGREAYELLKAGALDGLSIGYSVAKARVARDGVRELTEIKLWEVSLVTFPANEAARVTAVKSEITSILTALREGRAAITSDLDRKNLAELHELLNALRVARRNLKGQLR